MKNPCSVKNNEKTSYRLGESIYKSQTAKELLSRLYKELLITRQITQFFK